MVRAEGATELVADITVTCTGGPPQTPGTAVPTANFTLTAGAPISNRIVSSPDISDAMLFIDPGVSPPNPCRDYTVGAAPGGRCVQYALAGPDGAPIASSSPSAATPPINVFFGQVSGNQVVFHGVPILPPVAGITDALRIFRFTNLRQNVAGILGGAFGNTQLLAAVSVNGAAVPIPNPVQITAFFQSGLATSVRNGRNTAPLDDTAGATLDSNAPSLAPIATLQFTERFASAFRTRAGESGAVVEGTGMADFGTRLKAVIRNVPPGVRLWAGLANADSSAVLVTGEADPYVNGAVPKATGSNGMAELAIANGTATAVWEVLQSDPTTIETFQFGIWAASSSAQAGTAAVSLSLAPTVTKTAAPLTVPHFTDTSLAAALLTVGPSPCQYSVGPQPDPFSALAGSRTFAVSTTPHCYWWASADVPWIRVASYPAIGNGTVSVDVEANPSASARSGSVRVAGQIVTISQFGTSAPTVSPFAIVDPWNGTQGIAPGAWISIYGTNLAAAPAAWNPQPYAGLPVTLGGVRAWIDGLPAALQYVSPTLINALVPEGVHLGPVGLVVDAGVNGAGAPVPVYIQPFLPAIYSLPSASTAGRYSVTAVDPFTGQLVGDFAADPRVTRAVHPGDTIDLYAIGLGQTTPAFPTDTFFSGSYSVSAPFRVVLGEARIDPGFAALVAPGLYQVRITLPPDIPGGAVPIMLDFGSIQSAPGVFLRIQR
jgi:uncharacterized protein (TIGR03437 family)